MNTTMTRSATKAHGRPAHHGTTNRGIPMINDELKPVMDALEALVPPLWPLKDYVAVNPFLGLADKSFLHARQAIRMVRDCEMLLPSNYYYTRWQLGHVQHAHVEQALQQCAQEMPELYAHQSASAILGTIAATQGVSSASERYHTVAEIIDRKQHGEWSSHIINDITRYCSAHYDEGQASWASPWKTMSLFDAWRSASALSRRMDMLGNHGFRQLVKQLPHEPRAAIAYLLNELAVPREHWHSFLWCELSSVAGWASFVQYRVQEDQAAGRTSDDLSGLLAMRLTYDVALAHTLHADWPTARQELLAATLPAESSATTNPLPDVRARYVMQVAAEIAHRQQMLKSLASQPSLPAAPARPAAQMIFCIDVRSEIMRRHLESVSNQVATFGFAGFFGIALEYVALGTEQGDAQCPVLLRPGIRVQEMVPANHEATRQRTYQEQHRWRKVWKSFQTSAVSCFSAVESLGLFYLPKLIGNALPHRRTPIAHKPATLHLHTCTTSAHSLELSRKIDLAEGMLRNLGLTSNYARLVVVCGHTADVVNNPYKAGLDCGACGGHSGEPNARVAAMLLNDPAVRDGLATRGLVIPDDTWFLPAVHHTTTDTIHFLDTDHVPATHAPDIKQLQTWCADAGERCRVERQARLGGPATSDPFRRSADWSEVRPEWGLAGNAAFIVAPRSRTLGLDLSGRAFLHSYDAAKDPQGNVLELIMTAPMIVASWINLQYYASAVDNRSFGSGNKVIHNVVGLLGVLQGNGGDLMTGLPWQSVHDGERFQHEPLRLLVLIEATREAITKVIRKHAHVRDLVTNGWLTLVAREGDAFYRWTSHQTWVMEEVS